MAKSELKPQISTCRFLLFLRYQKRYHKSTPMKTIWMWIYQTWSIKQNYLFTELKLTLVSSWGLHRCFCVKHWWVSWWWQARWRFGSATAPEEDDRNLYKTTKTSAKVHMGVCFCLLTGKPCVMGTSILKRRILALNLVQIPIGSLGSQTTQPTLHEIRYIITTKHD